MGEFRLLAVAIIGQAYKDMQDYDVIKGKGKRGVTLQDYKTADDFFKSDYFHVLADISGTDVEDAIKKVNLIRQKNDNQSEKEYTVLHKIAQLKVVK